MMETESPASPFCAYFDESGSQTERFITLAVVSGEEAALTALREELKGIKQKYKVSEEIKCEKLERGITARKVATEWLQIAVEFATERRIRIDVMVCDMQDSRNSVPGRDDINNIERLYYHLIEFMIRMHNHLIWKFYPDENQAVNWDKISEFISRTNFAKIKESSSLLLFDEPRAEAKVQLLEVQMRNSKEEELIQLADIFAGLARFSRNKECPELPKRVERYEYLHSSQKLLDLEGEPEDDKCSQCNDENRCGLTITFYCACKNKGLGVRLKETKFLKTEGYNKQNPINFWHYEPQSEMDKAPTKR